MLTNQPALGFLGKAWYFVEGKKNHFPSLNEKDGGWERACEPKQVALAQKRHCM